MKQFLLPHYCKLLGQALLVAVLLAIMAYIIFDADALIRTSWVMRAVYVVLHIAIVLVTISREKNEDEMTAHLRGEALKEVGYTLLILYAAYHIIAVAVSEEGIKYLLHDEELITPFIAWALYYARFEHKLKKLRKREFTI